MKTITIDEIKNVKALSGLPDDQLQWILDHSVYPCSGIRLKSSSSLIFTQRKTGMNIFIKKIDTGIIFPCRFHANFRNISG